MKELVCAIVGFGKMGEIRYNTFKKMGGVRLKWVFDVVEPEKLPLEARFTRNIEDILQDSEVDVVFACGINSSIRNTVVQALDHGKHVFSEKPPGRSLAELQEMIAAEKRNPGKKLMFGFNHRHHESILHTKKLVDSGEYGAILWARGRYGKSVDKNFFSNWRSEKKEAGGGIFLDQGIHMLDLFLMLMGDFDEVKAFVSNLYWKLDVEDNVFAIFRNKKGQVASIHSTMTQWRHLFSLEIFLERGYITINGLKTSSNSYGEEAMTIAKNRSQPPEAVWTDEENIVYPVDNSWEKELGIFFNSIIRNQPIPVGNTQDAFKVMCLVEEVYKQA